MSKISYVSGIGVGSLLIALIIIIIGFVQRHFSLHRMSFGGLMMLGSFVDCAVFRCKPGGCSK